MENERGELAGIDMRPGESSGTQSVEQGADQQLVSGGAPTLRQQYVEAVSELRDIADSLRAAGADIEQVARALHAERCAVRDAFRALTPSDMLGEIHKRSLRTYGDERGPSLSWLRKQGKSWNQIIDSATRAGVPPVPPLKSGRHKTVRA